MAMIAGAIIAGVTALYSGITGANRARQAQQASMNAMYARANNAQANMMLASSKRSGATLRQMMMATLSTPPTGIPPWMAGGPGNTGPGPGMNMG